MWLLRLSGISQNLLRIPIHPQGVGRWVPGGFATTHSLAVLRGTRPLAYLLDISRVLRSVRLALGLLATVFRNSLLMPALLMLALAGCGEPKLPSPFHAAEVGGQYAQADFSLTDHTGKPRTLADFRGKVVVMFFGYVHCPDVCPSTMADLRRAMELLGKDADRVQVLFVTVDPERDTPDVLAQYVPAFHPSFLGLYGDAAATAKVADTFKVVYQKQPTKSGYNVDHTAGTYLIDAAGKVRLLAPYGQNAEWLAQDIRLLLALGNS